MENVKYLLEMENISKEFPGVKALDGVTLKVRPSSVHALMEKTELENQLL